MRGTRRTAFRRTAKVGVAALAASVLTFLITSPGSAESSQDSAAVPFGPGTGSAIALVYKVNPLFGNLSFGITAGESVAGHQNTGAQAQSKAVNLGVIGVTLAAEGCKGADPTLAADKQPQPVIVGSDDPGAADGKSAVFGGDLTQFAQATKAPFAKAITEIAPVGVPNGVEISGGKSTATSGIVKPGLREARAITEIGKVSLLGGLVTINGMRWEAVQQTGATTTNTGTFSLGSINLLGNIIPLPADGLAQLATLKDVLNSLGLTITAPVTRFEQGIVFVDPLKIGIIPSLARDNIISTLLGNLQSTRETLVQALNQFGCDGSTNVLGNNISTLITVLDLGLADVSGAGALTVELGGVQATTSAITGFNGLGDIPALNNTTPDLTGTLPTTDGGSTFPDLPQDVGTTGGTAPSATTGGNAVAPTKPIAAVGDGSRGGVLAGVAAGGLLLLLATAEADRRKMRRAQREIPLED
jgi:hypothetical protein